MSVCAVMLVKDEADILPATVGWLVRQVDEILAYDNGSTDGSREILEHLGAEVRDDDEVGYFQSIKTTALANVAFLRGHSWVIPVDADEIWHGHPNAGVPLFEQLAGIPPDVQIVKADLFNHLPTALDDPDVPLVGRMGWRQRVKAPLGKVAARCRPDLVIEAGNHGAITGGTALSTGGLVVRHYSWRTREQYLRKIRNGEKAYAATVGKLPDDLGVHWRMWAEHDDETVMAHFDRWFFSERPHDDDSLTFDPFDL